MNIAGNEIGIKVDVKKKIRLLNINGQTIKLNENETVNDYMQNRRNTPQDGGGSQDGKEEDVGTDEKTINE